MKALPVLTAALLMLLPARFACADEASHRAATEELLEATHVDKMLATMRVKQKESIAKMMASFIPKGMPEDTAS